MNNQDSLNWSCGEFDQFDASQWYDMLQLRSKVFVVEQQSIYQDVDGVDRQSWHLVAWCSTVEGPERPVALARLVNPGVKYPEPSIGRVVCDPDWRGQGVGIVLMEKAIELCEQLHPQMHIRISAQLYLEAFYERFGFKRVSEPYLEDGIPHVEMLRDALIMPN